MSTDDWVPLRTAILNGHAGHVFERGAHRWVVDRFHPDVCLYTELDRFRQLGPDLGYYVLPKGFDHRYQGTFILAHADRFTVMSSTNRLVTPGRARGMHPRRRGTRARLMDHQTDRVTALASAHLWALGRGLGSPRRVKHGHFEQADAETIAAGRRRPGAVVLAGGDWNENTADPWGPPHRHLSINDRMAHVGMVSASDRLGWRSPSTSLEGGSALDELFLRDDDYVRVTNRRVITPPRRFHPDHRLVVVDLLIRPAVHPPVPTPRPAA